MSPCPMQTLPYTIQPGDTLWQIAQQFNTTVYSIAALNPGINVYNLTVGQVICLRPGYGYSQQTSYTSPLSVTQASLNLNKYLRTLWEQHVFWTRLAIISIVFGLPDVDLVTNRLLRNPDDFAAALRPLYGDMIASRFSDLLKSHLVIASQLVKAAKAGDNKAAAEAEKNWYANADEIAAFLGKINPYWSVEDWRRMLYRHLALTKAEAVAILTKNYAEGINLFDEIEKQALEMADVMSNGIVKQFPNNFI